MHLAIIELEASVILRFNRANLSFKLINFYQLNVFLLFSSDILRYVEYTEADITSVVDNAPSSLYDSSTGLRIKTYDYIRRVKCPNWSDRFKNKFAFSASFNLKRLGQPFNDTLLYFYSEVISLVKNNFV